MSAGLPPAQPELATPRLLLRPFVPDDAAEVQRLADDAEVAEMTMAIPHPYPDGAAQAWIAMHAPGYASAAEITYAITRRDDERLLGAIALRGISGPDARGELGYWIGREHWSRGYCTEAAQRLVAFGCEEGALTRVVARCLARNAASARVMVKLGMRPEGRLVRHTCRKGCSGHYDDMLLFGLNLAGRGDA